MVKSFEELAQEPFWQGFNWAEKVFAALGYQPDYEKLEQLFRQVVAGDVSLIPSPEEAVDENDPEHIKAMTRSFHSGIWRRTGDVYDQKRAKEFLEAWDED